VSCNINIIQTSLVTTYWNEFRSRAEVKEKFSIADLITCHKYEVTYWLDNHQQSYLLLGGWSIIHFLVTPRPAVGPKHPSSHSGAENLPPGVKLSAHLNLVSRFRIPTFMPQFPHLSARHSLLLSTATTWFTLYSMLNYVKITFT